jgi:hypothetical protein
VLKTDVRYSVRDLHYITDSLTEDAKNRSTATRHAASVPLTTLPVITTEMPQALRVGESRSEVTLMKTPKTGH